MSAEPSVYLSESRKVMVQQSGGWMVFAFTAICYFRDEYVWLETQFTKDERFAVFVEPIAIPIPRAWFTGDAEIQEWFSLTVANFERYMQRMFVFEIERHMLDSGLFILHGMGKPVDLKTIAKSHRQDVDGEMKIRFGLQGKGRPEKVTKDALLEGVRACRERGERITFAAVAVEIGRDDQTIRRAADRHKIVHLFERGRSGVNNADLRRTGLRRTRL